MKRVIICSELPVSLAGVIYWQGDEAVVDDAVCDEMVARSIAEYQGEVADVVESVEINDQEQHDAADEEGNSNEANG